MEKMKTRTSAIIVFVIGTVFFLFVTWHTIMAFDEMVKPDLLTAVINGFAHMESNPFDIYLTRSFLGGMLYAVTIATITFLYVFFINRKTLFGKEQGSAEWATKKDTKMLKDSDFYKNMILSNTVFLSMNTRKTRLNNNIVVSGGSGSGKTRFVAKPNILQANCSYVITDPKGELLRSTGKTLEDLGYVVKVFNLIEKENSCCYNPFVYIHKESDVFKLIKQLIKNTNPPENKGAADPFWEKSEEALLQAIFFYLWLECSPEHINFKTVMKLIGIAGASEEDEDAESELDIMFRLLEERKGAEYIPCKQYKIFKMASGKTAKSILISVGVRLSVFNLEDIANLTLTDNLDLKSIGDKKTVLYIVIPDSDSSFNFLVSMMYSQLFDELYFQADFGELKWNDNKIMYRSKESLVEKKRELISLFDNYSNTPGEKKKALLLEEIKKLLGKIHEEFGLVYELIDNSISKEYVDKYIQSMESCLFRLRDRKNTLKFYVESWEEKTQTLKLFQKSKSAYKADKISEIKKGLQVLEMRIGNEYGIKKRLSKKWKPVEEADMAFIEDVKFLLKELECNPHLYGTRHSFDDKVIKLEALEGDIKKLKEQIGETSLRQTDLRRKLFEEINIKKRDIERIEILAEFEFGIKKLKAKKNGGRLPVHVRCILDEFANISPIPEFSKLVATMRSREISVTIIIQNISQLKEMYKDNWESLTGNCDTFLFLGGQEQSTLEYVSKKLGKATIDKRSQGTSKGRQGSRSENWDTLGRELMTPDEIGKMKGTKCLLFIRGFSPFFGDKYKLEEHPRYKQMGETDNPEDSRLFNFKDKFNTKETALGVHGEQVGIGKEFKKLLEKSVEKVIDTLDKARFSGGGVTDEDKRMFNESNTDFKTAAQEKKKMLGMDLNKKFTKAVNEDLFVGNDLINDERLSTLDRLKEVDAVTELEMFDPGNTEESDYVPDDDD